MLLGLRLYRSVGSPLKTLLCGPLGQCRFTPSCSAYAVEAVRVHGAMKGAWLSVRRIARCHPWGACGEDAVPMPANGLNSKAEGRNPKSEIRKRSEIRNPKSEEESSAPHQATGVCCTSKPPFGLRISAFFRPSDFGLRISEPGLWISRRQD
jgi:uncharacterized protein